MDCSLYQILTGWMNVPGSAIDKSGSKMNYCYIIGIIRFFPASFELFRCSKLFVQKMTMINVKMLLWTTFRFLFDDYFNSSIKVY